MINNRCADLTETISCSCRAYKLNSSKQLYLKTKLSRIEHTLTVSEKLREYILHREEDECEIAVCILIIMKKKELIILFINLVKLAEAIAVGANDLSLILPCRVGPQSGSSLPHESCPVTFRTPIQYHNSFFSSTSLFRFTTPVQCLLRLC